MLTAVSFTLGLSFGGFASAGSLKDVKHVVLFMQENRAFDHVGPSEFRSPEEILTSGSTLEQCLVSEALPIPTFK
jgi:phospholipase C